MFCPLSPLQVFGGGAAGVFAAITAKQAHPNRDVVLYEKSSRLLSKVKISGGGRCNVTHHCFEPRELVKHYPRGHRELLGPFHRFGPRDIVEWFERRGVGLKIEADGRMFPISDSSQEIIDCLVGEARRLGVEIVMRSRERPGEGQVLLATGSAPDGYAWAQEYGHTIVPPVPSLFTFNVPDFPLADLAGVATPATVSVEGLEQSGPLLITHWGFSGPAALKLSAWGARLLHARNYSVDLHINWVGEGARDALLEAKRTYPQRQLGNHPMFGLPRSLWERLVPEGRLGTMSDKALSKLAERLADDVYRVEGKTTHKAEFVTCGGVKLSEVNFKTMESRIRSGLYFAGEILDIDGVTGGFNFQNAWTTAFIASACGQLRANNASADVGRQE